jgi:diacylglycerol kinase (ATP)
MELQGMKAIAIINPHSANGARPRNAEALRENLGQDLRSIQYTAYPKHATEIAQRAICEGIDTIIAVGGDGAINEILNGMIGSSAALGIIPAGTANDLVSYLRLPTDIDEACRVIRQRSVRRIDLIRINDRYVASCGGFGFPCDVAQIANSLKQWIVFGGHVVQALGSSIYVLAFLIALYKRRHHHSRIRIQWGGHSVSVDPLWLMVDNQPFLGKRFLMSPSASNNDGLLDVCLVENSINRRKIISLVLKVMRGNHTTLRTVYTGRFRELTLHAESPIRFFGDGQVFEESRHFEIRILPGALNVIVPAQQVDSGILGRPEEKYSRREKSDVA